MNKVHQILTEIGELGKVSRRFHPESDELVVQFRSIAQQYLDLPEQDRKKVFDSISKEAGLQLVGVGSLAAGKAIDTDDVGWIRAGITGHIMEGFRTDWRENIRLLVLIYYAAKSIGMDFNVICKELIPIANAYTQSKLNEFCSRDPSMNDLDMFEIKEVKVDGKTRFVPA